MRPEQGKDAIADEYRDLRLAPVLRRLLRHTARLTGSAAGSVSLVDAEAGQYTKAAEYGALCRLGDTFPLDEGATGRAFARRRPVVIAEYGQLRAGHLAGSDPVRRGPAAAVPIWWRGDVIAVSVTFAPRAGEFTTRDVDDLEVLTQTVAAAIVRADRPGLRSPLTAREADVLELMWLGLTYREIATRLGLSPKTVEKHVGAIMRKTGASNRTAAVVTALDCGWLGLGDSPHTA
ncbi:LuxR C-terminal-related transcriptional regulator [Actinoplanes bogorensis]|uniref:LuxR C-terminal-related transcriptional regulator n=1 Tax=Paractinoplanes bogorensis TaxID=1610840 RepID=A0ABS5YSG1_9ACTN|nr:LuxR C-terminal-related transcriptional regulator [Actinoplanes bogorensis]MBU2666387.1 LuxR C-terminal-related transcriptional regulator [Actinoplanes bogorensis]